MIISHKHFCFYHVIKQASGHKFVNHLNILLLAWALDELDARNHRVTVLVHPASTMVEHLQKENFKYIVFKINMEQQDAMNVWQNVINA